MRHTSLTPLWATAVIAPAHIRSIAKPGTWPIFSHGKAQAAADQAVARGASREVAYREAGYKGRTNAPRMSRYPNVKARIAQLLAEAAARSVVTTDQLIAYLLDLIDKSSALKAAA